MLEIFPQNIISDFTVFGFVNGDTKRWEHNSILLPATNLHYAEYTQGFLAFRTHENEGTIWFLFTTNNIIVMCTDFVISKEL